MSFFYLSPVKGDMPVHILETVVMKRLEYLKSIYKGDSMIYNEFMVEGSMYDNVGHFMLCIVIILCENPNATQFFLKAEVELFKRRLDSLAGYDMRCFAKKLLRSIKKLDGFPLSVPLESLCQYLMVKHIAQHVSPQEHCPSCDYHHISLSFKYCYPFVARREVELRHGIALLPCSKWKQYLTYLFNRNLKQRIFKTNVSRLRNDSRISDLLEIVKKHITLKGLKSERNMLLSCDIDSSSKYFPPCMLNLHRNLRNKHRLSHTQRFYYSLFLKDIGMPVSEAIHFWRQEYQQVVKGKHSCCHHWDKDEKKFLYGIRHMYGLEGARKNYTSMGCQRIQSTESSCSEGGCPFKSFDKNNMLELIESPDNVISQINDLKNRGQYTTACTVYLKNISNYNCDYVSLNFSPVKYFNVASNV